MTKRQTLKKIGAYLERELRNEGTGHDWWHLKRVWSLSERIAKQEKGADRFLTGMIALLHDLDDWKLAGKKEAEELSNAKDLMGKMGVAKGDQDVILRNIARISFKGTGKNIPPDPEGRIVQDADRLDALGAVGVSRVFAVGGKYGRVIHDPKKRPQKWSSHPRDPKGTSINHFYEKILRLKDHLNTRTAKAIAARRHKFVEKFLQEFFAEWEGKR